MTVHPSSDLLRPRLDASERFNLDVARDCIGRGDHIPATVAFILVAIIDKLAGGQVIDCGACGPRSSANRCDRCKRVDVLEDRAREATL